MHKISFGLFAGAAILAATAVVYAQSATPIEGNPSIVRPAPSGTVMTAPPATTGAAPNSAAPKTEGAGHMPGGNPDRPPGSTQPTSLRADNSRASRHCDGPQHTSGPFQFKSRSLRLREIRSRGSAAECNLALNLASRGRLCQDRSLGKECEGPADLARALDQDDREWVEAAWGSRIRHPER